MLACSSRECGSWTLASAAQEKPYNRQKKTLSGATGQGKCVHYRNTGGDRGGGSPERALQGLAVDRLSHVWHPCLVLHGVLASFSVLMEGDRASSRESMLGQVQGAGHGMAKLLREGGFRLGWALAGLSYAQPCECAHNIAVYSVALHHA